MLKCIIILLVATLITLVSHKLTEKNIGFSMLIFILSFVAGIILLQPTGFIRVHEAYEWDSKPTCSVILPCEHSEELHNNKWVEASTYYDNITLLTTPDNTPVIIYCPKCYNIDMAREYYKKHKHNLE